MVETTNKLVELTLLGDLERGLGATVKIREENGRDLGGAEGWLSPPSAELLALYERWQSMLHRLALPGTLIKGKVIAKGNASIEQQFEDRQRQRSRWCRDCDRVAQELSHSLNSWLDQADFTPISNKLNETVSRGDRVRVLICSSQPQVKKLPWHLWNWLEREGRQAEAILSTTRNQPQTVPYRSKVKILIILGKSEDIAPENDLKILTETLGDRAEILPPLISPNRQEVNRCLWDEQIDILFFAGHSQTDAESGKFYINETEFIRVEDLKYALQEARNHGLKLAIFNSCDGLGLAGELESLYIPNLIVMRDIVHERVAQQFLSHFLKAFAIDRKPLHLAVLEARRRLQGLEAEFPCASWMPVIFQNSSAEPQYWQDWTLAPPPTRPRPRPPRYPAWIASTVAAGLVVLTRSLGILEPLELKAYDFLMAQRPSEPLDERILVVAADETDLKQYGNPLLKDAVLTQALLKLKQHQPRAVGVDIFRSYRNSADYSDLMETFKKNPNFIHVCAQTIPPSPAFSEQQINEQVGYADLKLDDLGNVVRRQSLWQTPPSTSECPHAYYSFSLLLAQRYLKAEGRPISFETGNLQFGTTVFQRLSARNGGYQKLNGQSGEILLNYRAPARNGQIAKTVPLRDLLDDRVEPKYIKNKVVLVGVTALQLQDDRNTPYGIKRGLWIHTHMVSAILSAVEDNRKPIWVLPQLSPRWGGFQWGDALWIWVWSLSIGLLVGRARSRGILLLTGCVAIGFLYQISLFILTAGGWMPLIPPLLSMTITGASVSYALSQSKKI